MRPPLRSPRLTQPDSGEQHARGSLFFMRTLVGRATLLLFLLQHTAFSSHRTHPSLTLAFTADHHGAIAESSNQQGGAARLGGFLQKLRKTALQDRSLFLQVHAGDLFQGTPVVNRSKGACVPPVLEALRMHVGIPGNHEWDYGPEAFEGLLRGTRPVHLSSNIRGIQGLKPWATVRLGDHKIGILGFTLPSTPLRAPPGATHGIHFDGHEAVLEKAAFLRSQGVTSFILLTHTDRKEAEELGVMLDADLVIGAHTNEIIPPVRLPKSRTWYAQSGHKLQHGGWIRLSYDESGRPFDVRGKIVPLVEPLAPKDPKVLAVVEPMLAQLKTEFATPLTTLDAPLEKGIWSHHSPLVASIAHAIRESSQSDLAMINPQTVRVKVLPAGVLTLGQLYEAIPYDNRISVVQLTGEQLDRLYEELVSAPFRASKTPEIGAISSDYRGVLQPSGFTVVLDPQRPAGDRIQLKDLKGAALSPGRTYSVATSDFLAHGGDAYLGLKEAPREDLNQFVRDAAADRLKALSSKASIGPGALVRDHGVRH